jgi:hypothetical protein
VIRFLKYHHRNEEVFVTSLQLVLTIGIPSILVVLTWLANNSRFAAHDKRFDEINSRLAAQDRRFDDVISSQHRDALEIMRNMTALHERVAVVEAKQAH